MFQKASWITKIMIKVIKVIKPFCLVSSSVVTIVLLHRFRLTLLNIFPSYVSTQRPPFLLYPSFRGLLVFFHRTRFRASGETLALLYRLKEGDCAQVTRKFVSLRTIQVLMISPAWRVDEVVGIPDT